jgi:hypothetical protein
MAEPSVLDSRNRFPLSYPQRAGYEAGPGALSPHFVLSMGFRLTGPVDVPVLQAALDDVVQRHELLRTVVSYDVVPPYQQVRPAGPVPLAVRDLPEPTGRSRQQRATDLLVEAKQGSVELDRLPLLRATLSRFDERDSVLTLITHHVPCDGWSMQLIVRDLTAYYRARIAGREPELPPVLQYREFALWQQQRTDGQDADEALDYWRTTLAGGKKFALPTDRPIPAKHSMPYSDCNFTVDAEVIAAAGKLARDVRGSLFMVLLAAFNLLAHRITGTTDPMINTTIHGRGQPEFANTVGTFLNWLPLRTDLSRCGSFHDVLMRTRAGCFAGYMHELPIQHIEQALPEISDHLGDPRTCNFIFGFLPSALARDAYQLTEHTERINPPDEGGSEIPGGAAWSMVVRQDGVLFGCLQYNREEFDEQTVTGWVAEYARLVEAAVRAPEQDWRTL